MVIPSEVYSEMKFWFHLAKLVMNQCSLIDEIVFVISVITGLPSVVKRSADSVLVSNAFIMELTFQTTVNDTQTHQNILTCTQKPFCVSDVLYDLHDMAGFGDAIVFHISPRQF